MLMSNLGEELIEKNCNQKIRLRLKMKKEFYQLKKKIQNKHQKREVEQNK
jgi:hypothetical protein